MSGTELQTEGQGEQEGLFRCACGRSHSRFRGRYSSQPAAYCNVCHAENMRLNRKPYSQMTDLQKHKDKARSYAREYQKRGLLDKKPCQRCGAEQSEKHHPDYSKPLDVQWLCRTCHLDEHYED